MVLWPWTRCDISGRNLWFKAAYHGRGVAYYAGSKTQYVSQWHGANEHIIWLLKQ